ncbi:hypothetical protein TNIN_304351 [Trichonephila inaurata madagascariensis]|uniref:Uncharacterized protein n=1 Tax=Trichonephila inaurata madagascariensis TaxID=2747483 RepID=A0A8X6JXC7_9ARAC|nr:hypothetical protein TNIN_304351 [Trichonephila inaurata madagascariensis]
MALQNNGITFTAQRSISRMTVLEMMRLAGFRRVIPFLLTGIISLLDMKITRGKRVTDSGQGRAKWERSASRKSWDLVENKKKWN